jgi:hypothetical protein
MTSGSILHPDPGKPTSRVAELAAFAIELRRLFEPYRPELHYMRGPGPKWHAKHDLPVREAVVRTPKCNVGQLTDSVRLVWHCPHADVSPGIANRGGMIMLNIRAAIVAIAAVTVALFAFSAAHAHEYRVQSGGDLSQTNQWDVNKAAPFTRDENDRFTP